MRDHGGKDEAADVADGDASPGAWIDLLEGDQTDRAELIAESVDWEQSRVIYDNLITSTVFITPDHSPIFVPLLQ